MSEPAAATTPAPATPRRGRLRGLLLGLLMLSVSSGIALVIGEIGIRLIAPQQLVVIRPDIWEPADSVGWRNRPNVRTRVNTGERTVDYFTDSAGFRTGSGGPTAAALRVLLLGDSFMQALQVGHEQSFAGLLEGQLSAAGRPVATRNAGVDGWDPPQYLISARSLLDREHYAALVVTIFTGNDAVSRTTDYIPARQANDVRRLHVPRSLSWSALVEGVLYPLNDWLDQRSHLFVFVKRRLSTVRMRLGLTAEYFPVEFLRSERDAPRWRITAGIASAIDSAAARHGVPALFVIIPTHYQVDPAAFAGYVRGLKLDTTMVDLEQPNTLLADNLRQRGLRVVDLLEPLRAAHRAGQRPYGSADYHLSPDGHTIMTRTVGPVVAQMIARQR